MAVGYFGASVVHDPRLIPNLTGWWDAADASTLTVSAGDLQTWGDKSNNGYDLTQGTLANRPRWGDVTLNSLNVVTFDAVNAERLNGTKTGFNAFTNGCTFIALTRSGANTSSKIVMSQALGTGSATTAVFLQSLDTEQYNSNFAGSSISVGSTGQTGWRRHAVVIPATSGNAVTIVQDDTTSATSGTNTSGTAPNGVLRMGTNIGDTGARFLGDIAEAILYARALTAAERTLIDEYLKGKWGI